MVKVTALTSDTRDLEFVAGRAARSYFEQAGARLDDRTTISLNGRPVNADTVVAEDGSVLIAAPKISNG